MSIEAPNKNQTAGQFLLEYFNKADWVIDLGNRFLRNPTDSKPVEAHLENLSNPAVKALVVSSVFKHSQKTMIWVCSEAHQVQKYRFELTQYLKAHQVEAYPTEEFSPYDQITWPVNALREHHRILSRLERLKNGDKDEKPFVLLVSPKNLLLKQWAISELTRYGINLSVNGQISPEQLTQQCLERGYIRTSLIMEPGEFSSRGDIFDLYAINGKAYRIEFFGDTIESIRIIDTENQRSVDSVDECQIIPRSSIVLSPENREKLGELLDKQLTEQTKTYDLSSTEVDALTGTLDNLKQSLEQDFHPDGIEYYAPLIHNDNEDSYHNLMDYFPADAVTVFDDWNVLTNNLQGLSDRLTRAYKDGVKKGRMLDIGFQYHVSDDVALKQIKDNVPRRMFLDSLPLTSDGQLELSQMENLYPLDLRAPDRFKADLPQAVENFKDYRSKGFQVFVSSDHPQRVLDACKEWDAPAIYWADDSAKDQDSDLSWHAQDIIISKNGPAEGFILPEEKLIHFTDTELFGRSQKRIILDKKSRKKRDDIDVINSVNDLRPGDYVVHVKHGIGQFKEIGIIKMDGERREYLTIQYSGTDKLHVPVDQVNLLSRYRGSGDRPAKLSKMGGTDWNKAKTKVKKAIANIARDLIQLYAKRAKARGVQFDPDSPWQVEMEEAFPFSETPDQWQAILDVKADMEAEKVMDRLICGDVGFGKTEVALRAIFKAVLSGKQVALLAPTTILVQQHFNTLSERFKPYPVRMGLLSRFRSPKEQKEVVNRLTIGECDVVVGTHRLLQKDIKFHDLGLLVIDEEQRFGVSHKEKIKQMRSEIDVLTMSATPIPRTLYMSLSGVREMSLIKTPPTNRMPIQTFVGPYNPAQVRMAILQEMDRGGQIYFVHNRVQTIHQIRQHLEDLVPEAKFVVGHGQMSGDDLETVMLDFAERQYDVLICTTIIESGLDIPSVNTIVIDQADKFGLAQLYQIRGRVGRSNLQAYAYCYYEPDRILTEDGKGRLRAIREFTTLGSGYQIALRDLEIRGVGNVLGAEQHGHMIAVGFDLYCQMLDEAIDEIKGNPVAKKEQAVIDLNVTAFIPEEWVGDLDVKLSEYKRLADISTFLALDIIQAEWKDRFGDIPAEVTQLVHLVKLRIMATDLGITMVRGDEEAIRISVPYTLQEWLFLQNKMPAKVGRKARWMPSVASKQGSKPVLLVKHLAMTGEEQVNYLMELFGQIQTIRDDIVAKNEAKAAKEKIKAERK